MSTVWETISQNATLVSLPDVYIRLREVLDDPEYCLPDVAEVISHDPAITSRLLRLVNSAFFGLATEVDTVSKAVSLLGAQEVHDLVLTVSVAQSFDGMSNEVMDMERFWRKSVACAILSQELASLCNVLDGERVFVGGLLSDIGHLFIYQLAPQKAQQAIELAQVQRAPLYKAERALLGTDYARIGADLMRQWQLPQSLWEATEFHVDPAKSDEYQLFTSLVHIASILADAVDQDTDVGVAMGAVSAHAWEVTGLSAEQCAGTIRRYEVQAAAVMNLVFPTLQAATA